MHEIRLKITASTNTYAKENKDSFPKDRITCISAEEQTSGRGRYQRSWISPKGNVFATFYFCLPRFTPDIISLNQVMAVSIAHILAQKALSASIKWPNDVQIRGKKIAGVLTETLFGEEDVEIFLGVGINVNMPKEEAERIDQPATSLAIETQNLHDPFAILAQLQETFTENLKTFREKGFSPFHSDFERLMTRKGEKLLCFDGKKLWEGICQGIANDGQLLLLLHDQTVEKILSGDIKRGA